MTIDDDNQSENDSSDHEVEEMDNDDDEDDVINDNSRGEGVYIRPCKGSYAHIIL